MPDDFPFRDRVLMTSSCRDCDSIPKVPGSGGKITVEDELCQLMHCGVKVAYGGYHGEWMAEIIRRLNGHHEPQEERVFHEILKHVRPNSFMLECGGFWSYYSLWFHHVVSGSVNYVLEPDPQNLQIAAKNFECNGYGARFIQGFIGRDYAEGVRFACESDWDERRLTCWSIDALMAKHSIDRLEVLHADIQGAEIDALIGAQQAFDAGRIRFVFLSTHHHTISRDPLTHQKCREFLRKNNAHIIADHTVSESFSGDGLLVASMLPEDRSIAPVSISYNRASSCGYQELEYDYANALEELEALRQSVDARQSRTMWNRIGFRRRKTRISA